MKGGWKKKKQKVRVYEEKGKKKRGGEWGRKKQENKQNRGGGWKTRKQGKKPEMVGKEKENKKRGFHQMAIKFVHTSWIRSTLLDGNPLVATKFNCHHWMANKMDSILAIRWRPKPFWLPSSLVILLVRNWKRRNMTNPLLLVSVPHKDGWLHKIWSPSNGQHLLDGDQSFFNCCKRGHATCFFENLSMTFKENFPKNMTPPLLWWLKQFDWHSKNSDGRMATKIFWSPHLVPFWSPPYGDWNFFSHHKDGRLKKFGRSPLWRLKNFRLWTLWWLKCFWSPFLVAIETFWLPQKRGVSYVFGKPSLRWQNI